MMEKDRIKINSNYDLERDLSSHAVINNNISAYQQRLNLIKTRKNQSDEIAEIKSDLAEIKKLLLILGTQKNG